MSLKELLSCVRKSFPMFAITLGAASAAAQTIAPTETRLPGRIAVAWNDADSGAGRVALMGTQAPFEFITPALATGRSPLVRYSRGQLVVIGRESGTIHVIDSGAWAERAVFDLGAGSRPVDIALVSRNRAYVTRADSTHLLRLDLMTGRTSEVIDLGMFADPDGISDLGTMSVHEGRLFVQIRRLNAQRSTPLEPPSFLAVIDLASETLIDVDPVKLGVQAIELAGSPPKLKMQIMPESRRLFLSASGAFWDNGGIEMIDLDELRSLGLVVAEANGQVGADLGAFVMLTPEGGFLTFSTDFALSSHLSVFSTSGSVQPVPDFYVALGYFVPALVHDPVSGLVYFPDAGYSPTGVQVFDARTGLRLTRQPVATSGPPTDLELLLDPVIRTDRWIAR